jgi:hypothetical protein
MQGTIDMNDELYNAYVEKGINIKEMITAYLNRMLPNESDTVSENKAYFQKVLEEVESGEVSLLDQEAYEAEMKAFEESL